MHNTGRSQRANWENIDINVDKEAFELNVFSIVNLTRVVLKYFIKQGKGHVAVNSSIAGIMGIPFSASYTGSKHALHVSKFAITLNYIYKCDYNYIK